MRRTRTIALAVAVAAVAGVALVVCTPLWNVAFGLAFDFLHPGLNVIERAHHPSCELGDRVTRAVTPLVSDEAMISYRQKNVSEMTAAAEHYDGRSIRLKGSPLQLEVGTGPDWRPQPYSVDAARQLDACLEQSTAAKEGPARAAAVRACVTQPHATVLMTPTFGRTDAHFFCSTQRLTFKHYLYFPSEPPKVIDGYLLGPVGPLGHTDWRRKVTTTTDRPLPEECAVRQLSERWFISLC